MYQSFDFYEKYEKPNMTLCNPNKVDMFSLNKVRDIKIKLKFNALSDLEFVIDSKDGDTYNPAYEYVQAKRLVNVENLGWFIIMDFEEDTSTPTPFKTVQANSLEAELIFKNVNALSGTYQFYDPIAPDGTLLQILVDLVPNWSVGMVDAELWTLYRTFDVSSSNIYNFMMTEMEQAYGCIFTFDTDNRTISAKLIENSTTNTDIFLSKRTLIEKAKLSEISSELITSMSVYGGNDLNIRGVNPLGGNYIYNFSYFMTTDWMSQGLIDALTSWNALIQSSQPTYASNLLALYQANQDLLALQGELSDLNTEYLVLEGIQKVRIETNQSYSDIVTQLNDKQAEIDSKQNEINNKEIQISEIQAVIAGIVSSLSFDGNFTPSQLLELQPFIIENTYQNKNIIQTDSMTVTEKQVQAQSLYDDALTVLERASAPRYEFSIDTVNFVYLKEFEAFTQQLELGCVVTINAKEDVTIESVLLEIDLNPTDPTDFKLIFSNRLRLDGGDFVFSDLFGTQHGAASSVDFNGLGWSNWNANYKDNVTTFINSSLDASVNNVVNADNQEILINQNGLRGKRYLTDTGTYSPNQVWLTSSTLAFTRDNWQTASLAIGQITLDGSEVYGVVADAIVGRLLAGNTLRIENEGNNFLLDSTGATLTNAVFTLQDSSDKVRINISPVGTTFAGQTLDPGITILSNSGGTWNKKFWVDSSGNLNFTGNLSGASGTFSGTIVANSGSIGGLTINSSGIQKDSNNYIRSDGTLKWGILTLTSSSGTFNGNIYANNLKDANGNSIFPSGTTMSGGYIYGGTPTVTQLNSPSIDFGNNASMHQYGGNLDIIANNTALLGSAIGASISTGSGVTLNGTTQVYGDLTARNNFYILGNGYMGGAFLATQSWVTSQGYYNSGDSPSFYTVSASNRYNVQGFSGYSYNSFSVNTTSGYKTLTVRGGIVTVWG